MMNRTVDRISRCVTHLLNCIENQRKEKYTPFVVVVVVVVIVFLLLFLILLYLIHDSFMLLRGVSPFRFPEIQVCITASVQKHLLPKISSFLLYFLSQDYV